MIPVKIKQQKQIKAFLIEEFGEERGSALFAQQADKLTALCRLFCDVDDVTYGGLKKLGFSRTRTLGYGEACCDFHFFKK